MRSDKYGGRDSRRDTQAYDGWEETQNIFQSRDREKEQQKKRKQREEAYQEYLALRENPGANRAPEDDVKTYSRKKPKMRQEESSVFEEPKPSRKEAKERQRQDKRQAQQKKKKRGRRARRIVLIVILLLIIAAAAGVLFVMGLMENVGKEEIDQANLGIDPQVEQNLKDYQNIALLGVDARNAKEYKTSRTDAIIILSIDKENKAIRQISVYRDTYLHANKKYGYDKVTNVHAYSGTTGTLHALNENMDLNIREAVVVNWKAVADAIDGIGGIDIEIQKSEIKEMNKYIKDTQKSIGGSKKKIKKAGKQTLNGNQAVTYARIRKDSAKGDYRRNERMKIVVSAAVNKAKKTNPFKLKEVADQVMPEIKTNMDTGSMMKVLLNFLRCDMTESTGWPFESGSWTNYNGAWVGPPVTLKRNVSELHEKFFGQSGSYEPTKTVQDISKEISRRTGLY